VIPVCGSSFQRKIERMCLAGLNKTPRPFHFERRCPRQNHGAESHRRGFYLAPTPNAPNLEFVVPADGAGAAIFREWRLRYVPNFYWHSKIHMGSPDVNYNRNCMISCRLRVPICSKGITIANCVCDVRRVIRGPADRGRCFCLSAVHPITTKLLQCRE